MDRRTFIGTVAGGLVVAPLAAEAQQATTLPRVGYLLPANTRRRNDPFWEGLREFGYVEGRNIVTIRRYEDGKADRYRELATELVRLEVNVIVADGAQATLATRQATTQIPIVMVAGDPVRLGLIASLAKPGGNVTGLSTNSPELVGKRLQLVKEAFPHVARLGVLYNALSPVSGSYVKESELAAQALRLQTERAPVPGGGAQLDRAFAELASKRPDAILVIEDPALIGRDIARISELALKHRLVTVAGNARFVQAGVLMSYGPSFDNMFRRTAFYVDKILKGAKPGDLPVEEPSVFELAINLKTAKALGLTIPQSLLARADEVIQ